MFSKYFLCVAFFLNIIIKQTTKNNFYKFTIIKNKFNLKINLIILGLSGAFDGSNNFGNILLLLL